MRHSKARCVFLSPHLDDVALSCGGLIASLRGKIPVEIWTIFCNAASSGPYSPTAMWLHGATRSRNPSRLYRLRRQEDRDACRILGASSRHFKFLDAPYRKSESGEFLYPNDLSGARNQTDNQLVDDIAASLRELFNPDDVVIAPLAIGSHIDHEIVKDAAQKARGASLIYYPDFPYVLSQDKAIGLPDSAIRREYQVCPGDVDAWRAAARSYRTQQELLADNSRSLIQRLDEYAKGPLYLFAADYPESLRRAQTNPNPVTQAQKERSSSGNSGGFAPIAIFAFRRLDLLKQTITGLQRSEGFESSDVTVFSDAARPDNEAEAADVERVRAFLRTWCRSTGAKLRESPSNVGLRRSITGGISEILEQRDRVIVMEDDLIVSRSFLRFMNDALDRFSDREDIVQVSGYQVPTSDRLPPVGLLRTPSSWGWGTWRRAWAQYRDDPIELLIALRRGDTKAFDIDDTYRYLEALEKNASGTLDTWAVRWYASVFLNGGLTLYPDRTLVRNIGFGDDGTNCKPGRMGEVFAKQKLRKNAPVIDETTVGSVESPEYFEALKSFYRWQQHEWTRPSMSERIRGSLSKISSRA